MKILHGFRAAAVFSLCLLPLGCDLVQPFAGSAEEDFALNTSFADVGSLSIKWVNGNIKVRINPTATELTATGTKKIEASDDAAAAARLEEFKVTLSVAESFPLQVFLVADFPEGSPVTVAEADLEVVIPSGVNLNIESTNGRVEIVGNEGTSEVGLVNGEIIILEQAGNVLASTVNGRVKVNSESGGVEADVTNGLIEIDASPAAPESIVANTVNGNVTVSIPNTAGANVDLSTVIGGINHSFGDFATIDLRIVDLASVTAVLNGGGATVQAGAVTGFVNFAGQNSAVLPDDPVNPQELDDQQAL
ncbi:MAG: hypothetical protein MI923_25380 [Phycisphaerales bacterium]|nr:hypothetical protein [Phycisphaerales bacterium]